MMAEATLTPVGPRWQRIVLVVLAVYGLVMLYALPAGQFVLPGIMLLVAVIVTSSAPGNHCYKQIVLTWVAALFVLSLVSLAWA
jgi:hypothetical protein